MINSNNVINATGCQDVPGSLVPLEHFNYTNERIGCLIQWNIQRTNFSGLTVSYHFLGKLLLALLLLWPPI